MTTEQWESWGLSIALGVVGLLLVSTHTAHCAPTTLRDRIIAAHPLVASGREPSVPPEAFADALLSTNPAPGWAALLMTVAAHETALAARIARGECRPKECDRGKAWGLFQQHRNLFNREAWGSPDINVQAREASHALRRAFYTCQRGPLRADWVRRTLSAYAGQRCDAEWPGLQQRLATYNRLAKRF